MALIADIMVTKGSVICYDRYHEGMAILRAGQQLAEANGLTAISVRGLLNISASASGIESVQGYEVAREAIVVARRLGLRSRWHRGLETAWRAPYRSVNGSGSPRSRPACWTRISRRPTGST